MVAVVVGVHGHSLITLSVAVIFAVHGRSLICSAMVFRLHEHSLICSSESRVHGHSVIRSSSVSVHSVALTRSHVCLEQEEGAKERTQRFFFFFLQRPIFASKKSIQSAEVECPDFFSF